MRGKRRALLAVVLALVVGGCATPSQRALPKVGRSRTTTTSLPSDANTTTTVVSTTVPPTVSTVPPTTAPVRTTLPPAQAGKGSGPATTQPAATSAPPPPTQVTVPVPMVTTTTLAPEHTVSLVITAQVCPGAPCTGTVPPIADITWSTPDGEQQVTGPPLAWTYGFQAPSGSFVDVIGSLEQGGTGNFFIDCAIVVDGATFQFNRSVGPYAQVQCSGTIP
jgi:hypothetical protein